MAQEHVLQGLEPDNLLAFLALLGFHRAVGHAEPVWFPRVYWDGVPIRPRIVVSSNIDREGLLKAAAAGCAALSEVHSFDRRDLNYTGAEARRELEDSCKHETSEGYLKVALLSALMSDAAVKRDGTVKATPYCSMFGQGHQHFLERMESVPKGIVPKELRGKITTDDLNGPAKLEQALFQQWNRVDPTPSFRWDPVEDRRYALRFGNPSGDKGLTVHGANRLASLAVPLLLGMPTRERGEVRLYAIATEWDGTAIRVRWPIWSRPATLTAILKMLAGCGTSPGLSIKFVYHSNRIGVEKYFNFTRAVAVGG